LTEAHLDVFLPELARSLTSLGVVLTELGGHYEAQALDREALTIYLRLHRRQPDRFADDVENAKRNMVIDLMNFGRTEGARLHASSSSSSGRPVPIPIEYGPASPRTPDIAVTGRASLAF
jgi:hypothetical protein